MPQVTQGRKRYLLPTPDRSKPSRPPTQDLSALKLDQGYKGTGVLRTTRQDGKKEDLYITSTTAFYIGRRPDCDYVVSYPVVSRRHMKIFAIRNEVEEALVCVEDVSTSNGILYNGSKPRSKSIFLNDGDTIEIPKTGKKFTYVRDPTASSPSNKKKISMTEMTTLPWNELEKRFGRKKTFLKVGNYRIDLERKLGSGTFGEVRLAWDEMREVQVACKTVRKEKMRDARDRERLLNELELGVALQHPNLNSVLCWKEIDGDFHIFLKLVTGGDLFSYVSKHQGVEQSETKYLLYQLLKGVKYMHESGCAHRDLKSFKAADRTQPSSSATSVSRHLSQRLPRDPTHLLLPANTPKPSPLRPSPPRRSQRFEQEASLEPSPTFLLSTSPPSEKKPSRDRLDELLRRRRRNEVFSTRPSRTAGLSGSSDTSWQPDAIRSGMRTTLLRLKRTSSSTTSTMDTRRRKEM